MLYGFRGVSMDIYTSLQCYMDLGVSVWISILVYNVIWIRGVSMDIYTSLQCYMDLGVSVWISILVYNVI